MKNKNNIFRIPYFSKILKIKKKKHNALQSKYGNKTPNTPGYLHYSLLLVRWLCV